MVSTFNARNAAVYERSMGRWSRLMAPGLLDFAEVRPGDRVLDVGCGTGSLLFAAAAREGVAAVTGIDASPLYVEAARERAGGDPRIDVSVADACALPFEEGRFDRVISQLVLQFIPDPAPAASEMRRVVRPGGTVAAAVWASGGGMPHQRMFWDTAALIDPAAAAERARTFARPMTRPGELEALFTACGLREVTESALTIWMRFADFHDLWGPLAQGEGTLGKYVSGLEPGLQAEFERHLRAAYESGEADGPRAFAATACVARGVR